MLIKPKNKRRAEPQSLAESIEAWVKSNELGDKMLEARLTALWPTLLGPVVARHTRSISIDNKILKIRVDNAPLRHQLSMSKTRLLQIVNEQAGRQAVIECLIF